MSMKLRASTLPLSARTRLARIAKLVMGAVPALMAVYRAPSPIRATWPAHARNIQPLMAAAWCASVVTRIPNLWPAMRKSADVPTCLLATAPM